MRRHAVLSHCSGRLRLCATLPCVRTDSQHPRDACDATTVNTYFVYIYLVQLFKLFAVKTELLLRSCGKKCTHTAAAAAAAAAAAFNAGLQHQIGRQSPDVPASHTYGNGRERRGSVGNSSHSSYIADVCEVRGRSHKRGVDVYHATTVPAFANDDAVRTSSNAHTHPVCLQPWRRYCTSYTLGVDGLQAKRRLPCCVGTSI